MTRFLLTAAFGLALALPTLAQPPQRPRENDEVAKLRAEVRELEERLKQTAPKKEERKIEVRVEAKGDKKPDVKKDEPKGPPMGGGFGRPPMGGQFNPFGGGGFPNPGGGFGGASQQPGQSDRNRTDMLTRMPGFDRLTKDEQATLTKLVEKMREPTPSAGSTSRGGGSVEARLDRLEKAIADLANAMRNQGGGGGRAPGPGSGPGGPRGGGR